jgi:hypothetical protein
MREDIQLKELRPEIFTEQTASNEIESFQNQVLRPILKYQHELIIDLTRNDVIFQKQISKSGTIQQKRIIVKQFFLTQANYKYFYIGQICGLMTASEFSLYLNFKKELDKRLVSMLADRILSYYC